MMDQNSREHSLKYPIGKFVRTTNVDNNELAAWINDIELFPSRLNNAVTNLLEEERSWQYRPGGWTIKQILHHCADSHMNSFIRFKLTLTEEKPTIKPYFEDKWAELSDTRDTDIALSLKIIEGLHARWVVLLKSLSTDDLNKEFVHPETSKVISLRENIGLYAWHCNHHLAHIQQAIVHRGEFV